MQAYNTQAYRELYNDENRQGKKALPVFVVMYKIHITMWS